MQAEAGTVK